jgi:hypothetical protein
MKLLQELFAQGLLSETVLEDLNKQVAKNGKTEEDIILAKNIISEETLFNLKSKISGIPFKKIDAKNVPVEVYKIIPEEASVNYKMAAVEIVKGSFGDSVLVGMVYPEDIVAQNALRYLANREMFAYQVCLITPSNLAEFLKIDFDIDIENYNSKLNNLEGGQVIFRNPNNKYIIITVKITT